MKRGGPRRNWTKALAKLEHESHRCRVCRSSQQVQAAHIVAREHDRSPAHRWVYIDGNDPFMWAEPYLVHPDRVVGLCSNCHREFDAHRLDLLPHLRVWEQVQAVLDAGGLEQARIRLAPLAYENKVAVA